VKYLGGKKRPTISQLEKRMKKMSKKGKEKKEAKRITTRSKATTIEELSLKSIEELYKEVKSSKLLTPYSLATRYKIKISTAKYLLRELESAGLLRLVEKSRRVAIYVPAA